MAPFHVFCLFLPQKGLRKDASKRGSRGTLRARVRSFRAGGPCVTSGSGVLAYLVLAYLRTCCTKKMCPGGSLHEVKGLPGGFGVIAMLK